MKYQSSLFFLLLIILASNLYSQQDISSYKPTVVPPPPDVASLGKFGDVPVSMYTGIPNISIPIYNLKGRELSVPISLGYHANGIKVEEIASRVGLGWALNAGGSISRTVRGLPDDSPNGGGLLDGYTDQEISDLNQPRPLIEQQLLLDQQNEGIKDFEPDLFHFSANGLSGKMFLDRDNNVGYPIPYQKLNILYDRDATTGEIDRFTMTSADGTKYVFGRSSLDPNRIAIDKQEVIPSSDSPVLNYYTTTWHLVEIISTNGEAITFLYTPYSANYCTKESETKYTLIGHSTSCQVPPTSRQNSTITIEGMVLSEIQTVKESAIFITSQQEREDLPKESSSTLPSDKALEKIEIRNLAGVQTKGFELEYSYFTSLVTSNYCGFSSFAPLGKRLKLDKVTELDENDLANPPYELTYETSISLPDRFSDAQDHWGYFNGKTNNSSLVPPQLISSVHLNPISGADGGDRNPDKTSMQAGILKEIKYPTGGSSVFTYEAHDTYDQNFDYEIDGGSNVLVAKVLGSDANLPNTGGIVLDEFTISGNTVNSDGQLGKIVKVSRWIDFLGKSCTYDDDDQLNDCEVNLTIRKKGGSATYPDANSVMVSLTDTPNDDYYFLKNDIYELVLEIDFFAYQNNAPEFSHIDYVTCEVFAEPGNGFYNKTIGGLRIKQLEHRTSASDPDPIITHYEYKQEADPTKSSGVLVSTPVYAYLELNQITNESGLVYCEQFVRKASSHIPLGNTQGSHIGYSDVQVYHGANKTNGKSAYQYTTALNYEDQHFELTNSPLFTPISAYDFRRGLLLRSVDYRQEGITYFPIQEVNNTYDIERYPEFDKRLHGIQFKCATTLDNSCIGVINRRYQVVSGWTILTSTSQRTYARSIPTQYVETISSFKYDNKDHIQMTKSLTTDSDGDINSTEYFYPEDYTGVSGSHPIAQLRDRHMHAYPVETLQKRNDLVISGTRFEYQQEHGNMVRRKVHQIETLSPFTYTPPTDASGSGGNYEERIEFTDYDTHGNILEFKEKDGTSNSYLWGYDSSLPIAQVVNADQDQIAHTSFEGEVENGKINGWTLNSATISSGGYTGGSYLVSGSISITLAASGTPYILSYWNGSSCIEQEVSGNTITVSGPADEVRVHPKEAQMTTYSYDEALRISSVTNANAKPVFYTYDGLGRLIQVIDHNGNIRSLTEYNFATQP